MSLIPILTGAVILLFGRKLFWLLAGAAGFTLGFNLASRFLLSQPEWLLAFIGAAAGLAGALLAAYVQNAAVFLAALIGGGIFLDGIINRLGFDLGPFAWFAFVAGGLGAGFLVLFLLEWALILLTSFAGASLIMQSFALEPLPAALGLFVLFLFGFGLQLDMLHKEERRAANQQSQE